jgi:hypothetical protein
MGHAEFKRFPLGRYPYKISISREELAIGFAHRKATGEPIQSFIRRLIREHALPKGSERFTVDELTLQPKRVVAPK